MGVKMLQFTKLVVLDQMILANSYLKVYGRSKYVSGCFSNGVEEHRYIRMSSCMIYKLKLSKFTLKA